MNKKITITKKTFIIFSLLLTFICLSLAVFAFFHKKQIVPVPENLKSSQQEEKKETEDEKETNENKDEEIKYPQNLEEGRYTYVSDYNDYYFQLVYSKSSKPILYTNEKHFTICKYDEEKNAFITTELDNNIEIKIYDKDKLLIDNYQNENNIILNYDKISEKYVTFFNFFGKSIINWDKEISDSEKALLVGYYLCNNNVDIKGVEKRKDVGCSYYVQPEAVKTLLPHVLFYNNSIDLSKFELTEKGYIFYGGYSGEGVIADYKSTEYIPDQDLYIAKINLAYGKIYRLNIKYKIINNENVLAY